ncbi:MAG: Crp/Fnr family transcriptional regulator [Chitinophagaceae bacterium]
MEIKQKLFSSLLNEEVYRTGTVKAFTAGSVIQNFNAYIKSIPVVLSGSIRVVKTDKDGHEILLYYIKPGESCIMSFLAGIHQGTSKIKAVVEEDAEVLLIPVENAGKWIRQFPEWTDFIFSLYQRRFEELLDVVNAIAFQKLDARIMHLLKQKAELFGTKDLSITHQQMADELGTSREAVSRILKQMENARSLVLSRNKISLR